MKLNMVSVIHIQNVNIFHSKLHVCEKRESFSCVALRFVCIIGKLGICVPSQYNSNI